MKGKTIVVWFSCGAASAVASKLTLEKYGKDNQVLIVNNPIKEEDVDNVRFKRDMEKWINQPIIEAVNPEFPEASICEVFARKKYMSGVKGAPCTLMLKKMARYYFERTNQVDYHVLGFTHDEQDRHERFTKYERANVIAVLIDAGITKIDCIKILYDAGIRLPNIYSLGYPNAICVGLCEGYQPYILEFGSKNPSRGICQSGKAEPGNRLPTGSRERTANIFRRTRSRSYRRKD